MAASIPCAKLIPGSGSLSLLLERLLNDARTVLEHYPDRAIRYVREALALLRARSQQQFKDGIAVYKGGLAPWQIAKVKDYISQNLASRLSDATLANLLDLSPGHFSRTFKISVGLSPHAYIASQRVGASQQMIVSDDTPLADVALACGFAAQAHFCHVFRRHTGFTPAAWRRLIQSEAA